MGARLAADIRTAPEAQTVVVPGTAAAEIVLPKLADSSKEVLQQGESIGADVERMLDDHPLSVAPDLHARRGVSGSSEESARNWRQINIRFRRPLGRLCRNRTHDP
jgi:hypothetical protein